MSVNQRNLGLGVAGTAAITGIVAMNLHNTALTLDEELGSLKKAADQLGYNEKVNITAVKDTLLKYILAKKKMSANQALVISKTQITYKEAIDIAESAIAKAKTLKPVKLIATALTGLALTAYAAVPALRNWVNEKIGLGG